MKNKFLLIGLLVIGLVACNNKKTEDIIVESTKNFTEEFIDEHTAQNSLDWSGAYQGMLPCADCEGIKTTIVLNQDRTFTVIEEYQKEPQLIIENKGFFDWDNSGFIVTLEGEDKNYKRSFRIVENAIIHLDNEGNEITGELANLYRLNKQ